MNFVTRKTVVVLCVMGVLFLVAYGQNPQGTRGTPRLLVTYDDGLQQALNYTVIKPAAEAVGDLGRLLFTRQWYVDPTDPFRRGPSVMTYDRGNNVRVGISPATSFASNARLRMDQPARIAGVDTYRIKETFATEHGAYSVPLTRTLRWVEITNEVR